MGFNDKLVRANKNLDQTKKELLLWANGYQSSVGVGFWAQNINNFIFYGLFLILAGICFFCKWYGVLYIILFVIAIKVGMTLWTQIKKLWIWLPQYLRERK
jgi:protein-S-isoprenylcysteine O-methyltransferase Ste14